MKGKIKTAAVINYYNKLWNIYWNGYKSSNKFDIRKLWKNCFAQELSLMHKASKY